MITEGCTDRLRQAKELIAEIDRELTRRNTPRTVFEQMRNSALAALRAELGELSELLGMTQHRLVFIGQVGVGKTTAICHLVGLTADREKRESSKTGPDKTIKVIEDLMATGAGFTTLCEVVVATGDGNRFEIEPYPPQEVKRTVEDFCLTIWNRVHPDSQDGGQKTDKGADQVNFPPELVRAVRNMLKLPAGVRPEDDAARRLACEFPPEGFKKFQDQVLSRAKLDGRTLTEFTCPGNEEDARAWIKKTFDDLNLVRLDTVSIPRRITLHVDAKLLASQALDVDAVVDTKGVDAAQFNREDLDRYIREDKSAICILVEGFDTAPTNLAPLLQRHVTPESPLSLSKFVLMAIPKGSEPERVVGDGGPVGDYDLGIYLRRSQIEETLESLDIAGLHLIFFDPLRYFESAGKADYKLRSDSDPEEVRYVREEVWGSISEAIKKRQDTVWERVTEISDSLMKIREGKGLNQAEEELVRQAKWRIAEHRHISLANADRFLEIYRRLWEGPGARKPMTLRATNNRFGVYPHRNIDIYYDAIPITEQLVRTAASKPKKDVLEIVRDVRRGSPEESDLRELFAVLEARIDSSFEDMVREVGTTMHDYLHDTALAPQDLGNRFWVTVQRRYGKGPGYRDDVLSMYADELDGHETVLDKVAGECWQRLVVDPVLEYLG